MKPLRRTIAAIGLLWAILAPLAAIAQAPPAVGALPDTERRTSYSLTASTCACAINMQLYASGNDVDAWLQVWVNGVRYLSTDPNFGWSLSSTTGPLTTIPRPITNAVLTFNKTITDTVQIVGAERPRQLTQFTEGRGVAARDLNQRLTEMTAVEREIWDKTNDLTGRGLFFAPGNITGPMPAPSVCAGKFLGFDGTGLNPQCNNLTTGTFSVPGTTVVGDLVTWNNTLGSSLGDSGFQIAPSGGLQLYASPTGNDANNRCTASGTPCTLKGACNIRSQFGMFLANTAQINIANGSYSATDANSAECTQNGNQGNGPILTSLVGNCTTPASVILAVPANSIGVLIQDLAEVSISCVTITGGNGSVGISAGQFAVADINAVHFGAFGTNSVHIEWGQQASVNILGGGEFVDGSATFHWQMSSNAILNPAATTITTNVSFSGAFLSASGAVNINLSNWTLTNSFSVSGTAAALQGPGYMITPSNTPCASALPGGGGCTLSLGFMDSAGDKQTDGKLAIATLPSPTRAGDVLYWNGSAWVTVAGNNSGTQTLQENASGVPSWATVAGTGTVTSAVVAASGGATTSGTCTITTSGTCTVAVPGGFLNVLRNNSLTSWFHGCVASACTITTAGGWCAEGVFVVPAGASVTCQRTAAGNNSAPYYSMKITGASGVTDVNVRFVVESLQANLLSSQNVTFQMFWVNGTGSTVTPKIITRYPSAQDNWTTASNDLASTSMQACLSAGLCNPAYTLTVTNNATPGYEFIVDFGNNFGAGAASVTIYGFDARVTPGVSTGTNAVPPPIEVRDPSSDITWNQRFFQATYDNGVAPAAATHVGIVGTSGATSSNSGQAGNSFRTTMRCDPSVSIWDGAGNANKASFWNGSAWTDNTGAPVVLSAGNNGFMIYNNLAGTNLSLHYTADCTISGG